MYEDLKGELPITTEFKLYSGSGNPQLAQEIADILGVELSGLKLEKFANGELYARFEESVRGDDVFVIQSMAGQNVNDLLMELLIIIDAAKRLSDYLGCSLAIAHKGRPKHNMAEVMAVIGDIEGKTCIINDDMIDTGGTLIGSINELKKMGAGDIYVCATHGIFSRNAVQRLEEAPIAECVVTNAIAEPDANKPGGKVKTISIANEFAECIYNVFMSRPVSGIFGGNSTI